MSLIVYKIIHLFGLFLLFQALGAALVTAMSGTSLTDSPHRKMLLMMHGIGLFLLLFGGFGMAARLGIMGMLPLWIWVKLTIWLLLGASLTLVKKKPETAKTWWILTIVLGVSAAALGLFKPF